METNNPFKQIEPTDHCPPGIQTELVSEIDLIRNSLTVVEVYAHDIFSVFVAFLSGMVPDEKQPS